MMCSVNGWGVGTKLRRTNRNNDHYDMEITGLGEDAVLIKYLNYDIQGEAVLAASEGDVFIELLPKDKIMVEIDGLLHRLRFLFDQLTEIEEKDEQGRTTES
jgi:hypothetical protein